jgi:hypothetical protein
MALLTPAPEATRRLTLSRRALPAFLGLLALALAFLQRRSATYTDTRIELTADPARFLERVASVWGATVDLGHVQSGQFIGYLWPMGPWFALGDFAGVPMWIVERLWFALVLFAAGLGVTLLMRALHRPEAQVAQAVAGAVFMCNPYVVVYANRSTVSLLAYAALPWLLLAVHRGLGTPRGWRWPAVAAVAVASAGAGVNFAVVFWIVLAPAGLLLYEALVLRRPLSAVWAFTWRASLLGLLASLWWLVPLYMQSLYGSESFRFGEQPHTIWSASSMAESLRLMGLWVSYYAGGFGSTKPASTAVDPFLLSRPVILATFLVPISALGGLLLTRRWRYAPFFGLLAVAGLVAMSIAFPLEKRSASILLDAYYALPQLQFLRTTYKAGPLVALSIACLAAATMDAALVLRARWLALHRSRVIRWAPALAVPAIAVFGLPLVLGRVIEPSFTYGDIPAAWPRAMDAASRATPRDHRILLLPGQQFSHFRWGSTFTPLGPSLTSTPVLQRNVARDADLRAAQLLDTVDDLIQQRRLVPGQLPPLLALLGVGQTVVASDGVPGQTAEAAPTAIAEALRGQPGFERPAAAFGWRRTFTPARGETDPMRRLPQLRRYDAPGSAPGIVRVHPTRGTTVLEGDGEGLAALAAADRLDPQRAVFYAADLTDAELRAHLGAGADLALTDTNRRRLINPSQVLGAAGPMVAATENIEDGRATYEQFARDRSDMQTVAERPGVAALVTPSSPVAALSQATRAAAALDGRLETAWSPPDDESDCVCMEIRFAQPVAPGYVRVHPRAFAVGPNAQLGISVDGGAERRIGVTPQAWNRIEIPGRFTTLRLRTSTVVGNYGIDEIDVPGLHPRETLRLPTRLASVAAREDLSRNAISIELARVTADVPARASEERDPELDIERTVTLPTARRFGVTGWATVAAGAPDDELDRLTGMDGAWQFTSSSRFEGVPGRRASSAFDGHRGTAWIADASGGASWLAVRGPQEVVVRTLRLVRGAPEYAFPARVDVSGGPERFTDLPVDFDGTVTLPHALRTRELRLDVRDVDAPSGPPRRRQLPAVAIAELVVPGLRAPAARRQGSFATPCGELRVSAGGHIATASVSGQLGELDAGRPLRVRGCGARPRLALAKGTQMLRAPTGTTMRPYRLSLASPAPSPAAAAAVAPGRVLSPGTGGPGSREDVRLQLTGPAWLVLAESYSKGWRAWCGDRALGPPRRVDGFANGWRVDEGCRTARLAFVPQRAANAALAVSAVTGLALLLAAVVLLLRRRSAADSAPTPAEAPFADPDDAVYRWRPVRAVTAAAGVLVLTGGLFSLRFGIAAAATTVLVLWAGVSVGRLLGMGLLALLLVPLMYATVEPTRGAPTENLAAHWLAAAAVCAVAAGCLLQAWRLRHRAQSSGTPTASANARVARS